MDANVLCMTKLSHDDELYPLQEADCMMHHKLFMQILLDKHEHPIID